MSKQKDTGHEPRRADQSGDNASFAFNGQMGTGVNRHEGGHYNGRHAGNRFAHLAGNPDQINEGLIERNRRGNASDSSADRMEGVGPSATRDGLKKTIATAEQGHNIGKHTGHHGFANPDAINVGMK
jgi:hypothetical protein